MPAGPDQHVYSSAPYDSPYSSHDKSLNNNNPAVNGGDESATSIFQSVKEQVHTFTQIDSCVTLAILSLVDLNL